jgi:prevent-host-death family protein
LWRQEAAVKVGVRELRNNLSRYLDRVHAGEEVIVTDHGRAVARVVRIASDERALVSEQRG